MRTDVLSRGDARYEVHRLLLASKTKRGPGHFACSVAASDLMRELGATSHQILSVGIAPDEDGLREVVVRVVWVEADPS